MEELNFLYSKNNYFIFCSQMREIKQGDHFFPHISYFRNNSTKENSSGNLYKNIICISVVSFSTKFHSFILKPLLFTLIEQKYYSH